MDKNIGHVTRKPSTSFKRDGKTFIVFFGSDGVDREVEVFTSEDFERERGVAFKVFCEQQDR